MVTLHYSSIKVITIVGLIILGIILDLGGGPSHDRQGVLVLDGMLKILTFFLFQNWIPLLERPWPLRSVP